MSTTVQSSIGPLLREWRQRRRLSQLDLSLDAEISTRHLSFLETGRAGPSREMVLRLAECLDVPLRERNALLIAAGFAPVFPERPLADPALHSARQAMERLLEAHEPYPALAIDRLWTLVAANPAVGRLMVDVAPELLQPPVNVLRLGLHPRGMAPHVLNYPEWRAHLLARLRRQVELSADAQLGALLQELQSYPAPRPSTRPPADPDIGGPLVPMRLRVGDDVLNLIGTTTVFGSPVDITVAELALETMFPADPHTADVLRRMATQGST